MKIVGFPMWRLYCYDVSLTPLVSFLANTTKCRSVWQNTWTGKRAKATEIDRSFGKEVFELAYTVTVNTFKETIDSLEETSIWN